MRTTTLPSMLEILTRNYNFRNKSAKLYELGRVYFKRADGLADEPKVLTLGAYGDRYGLLCPQGRRGGRSEAAADRKRPVPGGQRESLLSSRPLCQGLSVGTVC